MLLDSAVFIILKVLVGTVLKKPFFIFKKTVPIKCLPRCFQQTVSRKLYFIKKIPRKQFLGNTKMVFLTVFKELLLETSRKHGSLTASI